MIIKNTEKIFNNDIYFFETVADKIVLNDNYCGIIVCDNNLEIEAKIFIWDRKNNYEIDIDNEEILKSDENINNSKYVHIYNWFLDNMSEKFDIINGNISDDLILFNNSTNSINIISFKNNNVDITEKTIPSFDIKYHGVVYRDDVFIAFSEDEFIVLSAGVSETIHKSNGNLYYNKLRLMNSDNKQYVFLLISSKENQFFSEIIKYTIS